MGTIEASETLGKRFEGIVMKNWCMGLLAWCVMKWALTRFRDFSWRVSVTAELAPKIIHRLLIFVDIVI